MIKKEVVAFCAADSRGTGALTAGDIANTLQGQQFEVPADLEAICQHVDINQEGASFGRGGVKGAHR